jgi:hypothetical protein
MKSKIFISVVIAMFFVALINIHCNKDDGNGDFFIPDLNNQWTNKDDNTNSFFFLVDNANTNTSTFTGNENNPTSMAQFHFSGSFTNHNIQFTYDNNSGPKSGKSYSGTINDASNMMTLHSNDLGDLVLEKQ